VEKRRWERYGYIKPDPQDHYSSTISSAVPMDNLAGESSGEPSEPSWCDMWCSKCCDSIVACLAYICCVRVRAEHCERLVDADTPPPNEEMNAK